MKTLEKDKYIIYNDQFQILSFISERTNGGIDIFLPSITKSGLFVNKDDKMDIEIKDMFIDGETLIYLKTITENKGIYESNNRKLKKSNLTKIKNYLSCYKCIDKPLIAKIIEFCDKYDIFPELFSIDELRQIIKKSMNEQYIGILKVHIDYNLLEPLDELEKRIKYEKH